MPKLPESPGYRVAVLKKAAAELKEEVLMGAVPQEIAPLEPVNFARATARPAVLENSEKMIQLLAQGLQLCRPFELKVKHMQYRV